MVLPTMQKIAANPPSLEFSDVPTSFIPDTQKIPPPPPGSIPVDPGTPSVIWSHGGVSLFERHPLLKGNRDRINRADLGKSGTVTLIELSTGEVIRRIEPPSLIRAYFVPFLYPFIGFLVPWGGIKTLTWIGAGFS
jgi:hypothetical protein